MIRMTSTYQGNFTRRSAKMKDLSSFQISLACRELMVCFLKICAVPPHHESTFKQRKAETFQRRTTVNEDTRLFQRSKKPRLGLRRESLLLSLLQCNIILNKVCNQWLTFVAESALLKAEYMGSAARWGNIIETY